MENPGLPSGVSLVVNCFSMPASTPQAMTDVANPVNDTAAFLAHFVLSAVTIILLAFILKASAKVFSIANPFIFMIFFSLHT